MSNKLQNLCTELEFTITKCVDKYAKQKSKCRWTLSYSRGAGSALHFKTKAQILDHLLLVKHIRNWEVESRRLMAERTK